MEEIILYKDNHVTSILQCKIGYHNYVFYATKSGSYFVTLAMKGLSPAGDNPFIAKVTIYSDDVSKSDTIHRAHHALVRNEMPISDYGAGDLKLTLKVLETSIAVFSLSLFPSKKEM